jgi:hypothetical protein
VICPLEAARRKTLEEKFRHLKKKNISATEDDEVLPSPADVFNDNPMDLNEDYVNVEGPRPSEDSPGNKRDTQGEAERLYDAWKDSESLNRLGG